jgi:pimeloyl-ACP methyl ester carboxylesterase
MKIDRVIAADGTELALHRLGDDSGTPVVLVPGAFSDHRFWLGTRETGFGRAAAERGFSVWVLDPRGHGASERPGPDSAWRFRDWIRHDVPAAVRAATGAGGRAVVVAHSAGGAAALAAAAFDPETAGRIRGIAALSTPSPNARPFRRGASLVARLLSGALGRFPARALGLGGEDELGGVMAEWMGWNAAGVWRWPGGPDLLAALRPAPFPVLIATGSGDRLFAPPAGCRELAASLGDKATFREFGRATGCSEDYTHPGLLVSRAARVEVWPVILDWMESLRG